MKQFFFNALGCLLLFSIRLSHGSATELVVELGNHAGVTLVGALERWDPDGNPRRAVDPQAKIHSPKVDQIARKFSDRVWKLTRLAPGRYDLVILARDRIRIEGFGYPPILEFDPFVSHAEVATKRAREIIAKDIAKTRLYENKVNPLYFAGSDETVRVFVQLLRDSPTSLDKQYGEPVATLRHEVWQFTNRYGAWTKEKRTRVFDRILMPKRELRQWTWIWEPVLGNIEVSGKRVVVKYALPDNLHDLAGKGMVPY